LKKNDIIETNSNNSIKVVSTVNSDKIEKTDFSNITMDFEEKMEKQILQSLPQEALITCAKLEGTNIALYTKKP